jgi:hypothetical protein
MKSKPVVEEMSVIHDNVEHQQSTNTTRSCTSKSAPVNYTNYFELTG